MIQRSSKSKGFTNKQIIKSPSDTTLYAPALRKEYISPTLNRLNVSRVNVLNRLEFEKRKDNEVDNQKDISFFVDEPRRETNEHNSQREVSREEADDEERIERARKEAEETILDAERFKATIAPPHGKDLDVLIDKLKYMIDSNDWDDEFFHLTCHVDLSLKQKIENGEFVELEKLLPADKRKCTDENLVELVNKSGNTFFRPASNNQKITNVRRWEQAFRVYAAIYSSANPSRSAEIWQYVYVINSAANTYVWDNVYYYDYTFRQLMHSKPKRSWAKIYNQLWNLAMKDPIPRSHAQHTTNNNSNSGDWKDKCCWRFNKGVKYKTWMCKFEHRCKYYGSYAHPLHNCPKRKNNGGNQNSGQTTKSSPMHSPKKL